jgi:hypothetical protein
MQFRRRMATSPPQELEVLGAERLKLLVWYKWFYCRENVMCDLMQMHNNLANFDVYYVGGQVN